MQHKNQLKIKFLAIFIILSIGLSSSFYNIYSTRTYSPKPVKIG